MRVAIALLLAVLAGTGALAGEEFHASDPVLAGLIEQLLEDHPGLLAADASVRAQRLRVDQAGSLPDPTVSLKTFLENPETRVGPQQFSLEFSQAVPWGGKRGLQAERATTLADSRDWERRDLQRALVAELKRAYFEIAYLEEAMAVNREEVDLLERFEQIALRRYATGEGIQQSVIKLQADLGRLQERQAGLREQRGAHLRRIARLVGKPEIDFDLHPAALEIPAIDLDRTELEESAVSSHPAVHARRERIEADRLQVERRRLDAKPDFRFGIGYTAVGGRKDAPGLLDPPPDNGDDIAAVTVGINLPVFRKRIRAGVAEAEEKVRTGEQSLQAVENRLRWSIQESFLRIESLRERAGLYREVIIPQARQSLSSAEAAYSTGKQGLLDLLDSERVLFQARLSYHRLVADSWIALAELERSGGRPVSGSEDLDEQR
jgi:outer membrane protein TolC